MNLRPHRREIPEINLTPLIDVVFLLLIFFMVTTSFRDEGRLRLQLPAADAEALPAEESALIEVMIDRAGRFYVNRRALADADLETLQQALRDALGDARERPLVIKADAHTPHQAVMRVLDAAGQLGLTQVAFAASRNPDGSTRPDSIPAHATPAGSTPAGSATEAER